MATFPVQGELPSYFLHVAPLFSPFGIIPSKADKNQWLALGLSGGDDVGFAGDIVLKGTADFGEAW